jgi:hypothetical protein
MPGSEGTKLTLRLSPEARETIEKLSQELGGITASEVIRRALGTELFFVEEKKKGSKILLEDDSQRQREIVMR